MLSTANGMLATKNPAPSASTANRAGDIGMKAGSVISVDHRKRSATRRRGLRIRNRDAIGASTEAAGLCCRVVCSWITVFLDEFAQFFGRGRTPDQPTIQTGEGSLGESGPSIQCERERPQA